MVDRFFASKDLSENLETLGYVEIEYWSADGITPLLLGANLALHLALFATLWVLVHAQGSE